jgi:hypothetical protein
MSIKSISTCFLASSFLLSGCSNDSNSDTVIATPKKQLKTIDFYSSTDNGKTLSQTRYDALSYANGRLAKIDSFTNMGNDGVWGTSDDPIKVIVKCHYSGQKNTVLRDPRLEFSISPAFPNNVTIELLMIILGLESNKTSCAIDYQDDLSITGDIFIPKLVEEKDQDKPIFSYKWQSLQANNVHIGSEGTMQFLGINDMTASSNKYTFNYSGSDIIIDPIKKQLHRYTFDQSNIKTEIVYHYDGDVNTAISTIDTLPIISTTQFERTATMTRSCKTAISPPDSQQTLETLNNGLVVQKDILNAGTDGKACTNDDFIVSREKYNYQ